jgi:hypothetical protein
VSGQLRAPATLLLGKEPPVPIGEEEGWAPQPVWMLCIGENPMPLSRIEPRFRCHPFRSLVTILTELSRVHMISCAMEKGAFQVSDSDTVNVYRPKYSYEYNDTFGLLVIAYEPRLRNNMSLMLRSVQISQFGVICSGEAFLAGSARPNGHAKSASPYVPFSKPFNDTCLWGCTLKYDKQASL